VQALCLDVTVPVGARGTRRTVRLAAEVGYGELAVARAEPADAAALARAVAVDTPPGSVVVVGGVNAVRLPPEERKIGYVPAGGGLLPQLTIRRNITYGLGGRVVAERLAARHVDQASEQLGLALVLDLRPHEVTEDERLRAALARAAVRLPEVLVVDLPEALVDDGTGARVKPVPLAKLVRAASLARFDVAALVCSADPRAVAQVRTPLTVDQLDAGHAGPPTLGPPDPDPTGHGPPGGPPDPGGGAGEGGGDLG
jgi:ABC-type thiamine transport system ATPase subunit